MADRIALLRLELAEGLKALAQFEEDAPLETQPPDEPSDDDLSDLPPLERAAREGKRCGLIEQHLRDLKNTQKEFELKWPTLVAFEKHLQRLEAEIRGEPLEEEEPAPAPLPPPPPPPPVRANSVRSRASVSQREGQPVSLSRRCSSARVSRRSSAAARHQSSAPTAAELSTPLDQAAPLTASRKASTRRASSAAGRPADPTVLGGPRAALSGSRASSRRSGMAADPAEPDRGAGVACVAASDGPGGAADGTAACAASTPSTPGRASAGPPPTGRPVAAVADTGASGPTPRQVADPRSVGSAPLSAQRGWEDSGRGRAASRLPSSRPRGADSHAPLPCVLPFTDVACAAPSRKRLQRWLSQPQRSPPPPPQRAAPLPAPVDQWVRGEEELRRAARHQTPPPMVTATWPQLLDFMRRA